MPLALALLAHIYGDLTDYKRNLYLKKTRRASQISKWAEEPRSEQKVFQDKGAGVISQESWRYYPLKGEGGDISRKNNRAVGPSGQQAEGGEEGGEGEDGGADEEEVEGEGEKEEGGGQGGEEGGGQPSKFEGKVFNSAHEEIFRRKIGIFLAVGLYRRRRRRQLHIPKLFLPVNRCLEMKHC